MESGKLAGELTIYQAENAKQVFCDALERGKLTQSEIELDLSGVTECDGAGLQMLLSLARSADALGLAVRIPAISPAVTSLLADYGVAARFSVSPESLAS